MGRLLKGFGVAVFGLVALVALLYLASRAMPIPRHEAEALARVETLPVLPGRNGFAALWSLARDVDAGQVDALLEEEARRMASMPAWGGEATAKPYVSVLERFPLLSSADATVRGFCDMREAGCLRKVRSDPQAYAALEAGQRVMTARIEALDAYGHFRSSLPPGIDAGLPSYAPLTRNLTVRAQRFAAGETDVALQGVCRDASLARKLATSGDNLVGSMVGVALYQGSAALFVDMLAELPPEYPLPATCHQVFVTNELMTQGICPMLRGEGRWITAGYRGLNKESRRRDLAGALLLDVDKTVARGARTYDWYCGKEAGAFIAADMPLRVPAPPSHVSFRCLANAIGCTLIRIQAPAYADYALRLQDAAMRQKAVGAWLWLRAQAATDPRPLAERLQARPEVFKSAARDIRIDGATLQVSMYERRPGDDGVWRLPVPGWMSGAAR